jgi:tetratricopeptide (TPR) repeat protein
MKLFTIALCAVMFYSCSPYSPGSDIPQQRQQALADALAERQLYEQAIAEYKLLLERYKLDFNTRAEVNFTIGDILHEQLNDYANALTYFSKIQHLFPESSFIDVTKDRIISCLEKMGRSAEAARLARETESSEEGESPFEILPGDTIAVVDDKVLTTGEFNRIFNYYYSMLSPDLRGEAPTRDHKLAFLRDYIKSEVLYNSAKRRGIDKSQEFKEMQFLQMRDILIQNLLKIEIYDKIEVGETEIEDYFNKSGDALVQTNPDGTQGKPSLDEARDVIRQILIAQKGRRLQEQLTDRLIEAQDAQIHLSNIKE